MTCPETICCSTQLLYNLQVATMTQLEFLQNEFNLGYKIYVYFTKEIVKMMMQDIKIMF